MAELTATECELRAGFSREKDGSKENLLGSISPSGIDRRLCFAAYLGACRDYPYRFCQLVGGVPQRLVLDTLQPGTEPQARMDG
jgi:hypothetical protein